MFRSVILSVVVISSLYAFAYAGPAKKAYGYDAVEEMRSMCNEDNDSFACMKYKVMNFIENIIQKDNYKITNDVEVRKNEYAPVYEQRSEKDVFDKVEDYVQSHDFSFNFPSADAKVTLSPKALDDGELNVNVKFNAVEERGKKSKLKKLMIPILVFVLLKAMTLVPLALGVLGLKAWNALQLSFFSFIISFALAVFQLCKKLAADHHHHPAITHAPWEAGRSFVENFFQEPSAEGQNLAYNSYA